MASKSFPDGRFGKYSVLAHLATGGMGKVYRAVDNDLGRSVALKILPASMASNPAVLERFRREARHAARLVHRHIVTLYEYGQDPETGLYFLAMEYVQGVDLAEFIHRKGRLRPEEARRILIQAVKALGHAFEQGVTHRDIKPSNFLLAEQERRLVVKLTDFGLARAVDDEDFRVTRAGSTVGTIDYLSPEQARDSATADVRSDIYSLGCTFYHMLAGHPPFPEGGLGERVYKHMEVPPPDVRQFNPRVSAALWQVLQRMLAKEPLDRYQTPEDLLDDLKRVPAEASEEEPTPEPAPTAYTDQAPPPTLPSIPRTQGAVRRVDEPEPLPQPPPSPSDSSFPFRGSTPAPHKRRRRRPPRPVAPPPEESSSGSLVLSAEHMQVAAGQFERASAITADGNLEYAIQLLLSCCKLDPTNLLYREKLREVGRTAAEQKRLGGWLASLSSLATKTRLKAAKRSGKHRNVLEYGEELLVRNPHDLGTQLDMVHAAEELGLTQLAVWLLEKARDEEPNNPVINRHLALLYENLHRYSQAIALWQLVRKADPTDPDALKKINALSARDTIARGNYQQM
jgi:serine/threonine protein kinase